MSEPSAEAPAPCGRGPAEYARANERRRMVDTQLRGRDITDVAVLDAMASVPRHAFVPEADQRRAYDDMPLPIGFDQTISQPYIVAFMTQALRLGPRDRVLEIGTGCGYQSAVLARLAGHVYSVELVQPLAQRARATLDALGCTNVDVRVGDGFEGWAAHAPYDRIIVTAAPEEMPRALLDQLAVGGVIAIPVGRDEQVLRVLRKTPEGMETLATLPVRFVPMRSSGPPSGERGHAG